MPVTLLQRFLGHRSLESTMRYLHSKNEDVALALAAGDFSALSMPPAIATATPATSSAASTKDVPTTGKFPVGTIGGDATKSVSQEEPK